MPAALGQVEIQSLPPLAKPAWFTPRNSLFDDAREGFRTGALVWQQASGFVARLFNSLWVPDFTVPTFVSSITPSAWVAPGVALAGVTGTRGYCQSDGVRFPSVLSAQPLAGMAIYVGVDGRLVWAANDFFGNLPVDAQDVYVQPASSFERAWFRL